MTAFTNFLDDKLIGHLFQATPLTAARNITTGATPNFAAGQLSVQIDN